MIGVEFSLVTTSFTGGKPTGAPSEVTIYLSFKASKMIEASTIPKPAAKKPHLKSAGFPVSPKKPVTNGAINAPRFIPM